MKKILLKNIYVIFILCNFFSCYSQKNLEKTNQKDKAEISSTSSIELLKSTYNLNDEKLASLSISDSIKKELILSAKDSLKVGKVKKRLDLFFENKYDLKKLYVSLKLERLLEGGEFEFTDSLPKNALRFETVEEFNMYKAGVDSILTKSIIFKKKIVKDSIKKNKL